jgi:cephalosporin hydroxylase
MEIDLVLRKHYCDKANDHHCYSSYYDTLLSPIKNDSKNLLEIGIFRGESIKAWFEYLPYFSIHAVDVCPREKLHAKALNALNLPRISATFGDSTHAVTADAVRSKQASFDVIIDDGMHLPWHNLHTFLNFFPLLKTGGTYVIEDVHPAHIESLETINNTTRDQNQRDNIDQYKKVFFQDQFLKTLHEAGTVTYYDSRHLSSKPDSYIIQIVK